MVARARAGASLSRPGSGATAGPEHALEEVRERRLVPEHVSQVLIVDGPVLVAGAAGPLRPEALPFERLPRRPAAPCGPLPLLVLAPARADLVVLLALVGVGQDLVRLVDLLEALLGLLVPGVDVRMVLPGELAVGGPDLLLGGGLRHAQHGVVVLEFHQRSSRKRPRWLMAASRSKGTVPAIGGPHPDRPQAGGSSSSQPVRRRRLVSGSPSSDSRATSTRLSSLIVVSIVEPRTLVTFPELSLHRAGGGSSPPPPSRRPPPAAAPTGSGAAADAARSIAPSSAGTADRIAAISF